MKGVVGAAFLGSLVGLFVFLIVVLLSSGGQDTITLERYDGPGNGVLKHGIVLKEEYKGPESISGELDLKGIWIIK